MAGLVAWAPAFDTPVKRTSWGVWLSPVEVLVMGTSARDRRVALREPLTWENPDGSTLTVPEGWTSDGATLPAATWWALGGRLSLDWIRAAIVHDYLCADATRVPSNAAASEWFYRGLRADGMGFNRARLAYHATRLYGPQWGPT
jgi:hypothetical protein